MEVALQKTVNRVAPAQLAAAHRIAVSPQKAVRRSDRIQLPAASISLNERSEKKSDRDSEKVKQIQKPEMQVDLAETGPSIDSLENKSEKASNRKERLQSPYITKFADTGIIGNRSQVERKVKKDVGEGQKTASGRNVAGTLKSIGKSKVSEFLASKGQTVLLKGIDKLQRLKQNEITHDTATEKLNQSERAVVIPTAEGQSKSNTNQVGAISSRPAPAANENKAKQQLQQSLAENIPQNIEDVDNFKSDKKARQMGADVMSIVQVDKNAVVSTFADMQQNPQPAPPEQTPELLPPEELAPATPNMNLGQGAIAPLQQEHTDVSNFTKEADSKLNEEGVTQEQLEMVDSGDLAEANKEKKGVEKMAKTEPLAVQNFARQEAGKVDTDLRKDEKKDRDGLKTKRKADLGTTTQKQKGTKSSLEKKREEVAEKINGIFKTAQDNVKKKLTDLETNSMKSFDQGNAKASKEFEDNVSRELNAFKSRRYSGLRGKFRKAKDWLLGMDDLPEVKAIFERNRATFVNTINKLVEEITAANKRVIQECKEELANAKKEIKGYVDKLGPGLKEIGNKAAKEMNSKLAELDRFVNQKEEELQQKLADKQKASIKAIDEKIEKMKEAMSGALSKLGKLLLLAAKKFFTWALQKFGYSLEKIEAIISRGAAILKAIFTKPIQFVKNLVNAAITGFKNFGLNFLKHLKNSLFEWLTGSLEGLILPKSWDFKGIVSVALQMIGISYQNIRKHMVAVMGEPVVSGIEKTFTLVKTLITEGPMAAWEQLKEMAGEMQNAFVEAVKDFIKIKVIEQAIQWVVSIFIPGAGIIKAIVAIYDTIVFFIQKAKQIAQMIGSFLGSIGEIASGNIGAAADALENGLARGLTLVISFLAQLLRLSGITNKIKGAIQKIRDKVDNVLAKVAKWIADKAKKLFGTAKEGITRLFDWWKERQPFSNKDGESHTLFFQGSAEQVKLMVATTPNPVEAYLDAYPDKESADYKSARSVLDNAKKIIFTSVKPNETEAIRRAMVKAELLKISLAFARLAGDPPGKDDYPKTTPPTYSGPPAKNNHVEYIIGIATGGTRPGKGPDTKTPGWKKVFDAGLTRITDKWVQMHVISEQLGGKAQPENLISAPNSVNTGSFRSFELSVKKLANESNRKIKNVVWVKVTVSYFDGEFANKISGKAGLYFWKGKGPSKWIKNESPSFSADAGIPRPDLHINKQYSLNFSSGTDLRKIISDPALVEIIRQNRPYSSSGEFRTKVTEVAIARGIRAHSQKINGILSNSKIILHDVTET